MLILVRRGDCPFCDEVEDELKHRSLAYRTSEASAGAKVPAIFDFDRMYFGSEEIKEYFERIDRFRLEWDKFQTDACYCDEDRSVDASAEAQIEKAPYQP